MSIRITEREVNGVAVLDCSGRITLGEATLRETIRELVARGQKNILLNLDAVGYVDSTGIQELVNSFISVSNQGGNLKLMNLQKRAHDLLQITTVYTAFEVYDDEAEAIASFGR